MSRRAETVLKYFDRQKTFVRERVKSGVELYRKGGARLRLTDARGEPLRDAPVRFRQTRQAFRFGANLFMLDELETPEKNAAYKARFRELFNLGTVPFYWRDQEPEEGKPRYAVGSPRIYRRPPSDLCVNWCLENGVEPKLHCLNYDVFAPDWVAGQPTPVVKAKLSERFRQIAARYALKIPMVEVTNETFLTGHRTAFFYEDDYVEWSFREAAKYFPHNRLVINEANIPWDAVNAWTGRNPYYQQIESLLDRGVPVQGVGLQFHSFFSREDEERLLARPNGRYSPEYLCAVMDRFERLGLPLQITEMTIPAYSADPDDEFVQAEILRYVYSLFFAQRSMEAVIYWNVPDGYAYRAEPGDMTAGENVYHGGLLRFDFSEKPAWTALKRLIREEWTTDVTLRTDGDGGVDLRGFYGDYEVTKAEGGGRAGFTLSPNRVPGEVTGLTLR